MRVWQEAVTAIWARITGFTLGMRIALTKQNLPMDFYIDPKGYMRFTDSHTLVHRWMAEKKLGRRLRDGEVVHHIDRNKLNNYPENLYVCKNQYHHYYIHLIDARKFGWETSRKGFEKLRSTDISH
jgi:hypothetical protein